MQDPVLRVLRHACGVGGILGTLATETWLLIVLAGPACGLFVRRLKALLVGALKQSKCRNDPADSGRFAVCWVERLAALSEPCQLTLKHLQFAYTWADLVAATLKQLDDVVARRRATVANGDDVFDLGYRESDRLRSPNEGQP